MRTKRILKAFCLSAALLSIGLTASRAMAACPALFANSFYCIGEVSSNSANNIHMAALAGPVSGGGQTGICTTNTAGNPCVTSAGITTLNFANGSSATVNYTGTVGASGGCSLPAGFPANTANFCNTTALTANGSPVSFSASADNSQCTAKGKPLKCCTGSNAGTCQGNICIINNTESCPSNTTNCETLKAFLTSKTPGLCSASAFGCEFASDTAAAGQGVYTYGSGTGDAALLTGCSQQVQFTANKALDHFAYVTEGPLTGSCTLNGLSMNIRCQGTGQ